MRVKYVCIAMIFVATVGAQDGTGSLSGTVVDATDAVIPQATITVVSAGSVEAKTDQSGKFVIGGLAPGVYTLQFRAPGFVTRNIATTVVAGRERSLGRAALNVGEVGACLQKLTGQVIDKKLKRGSKSSLSGHLLSGNGVNWKNATVELRIAATSQVIAIAKTDENGTFNFLDVGREVYDLFFDGFLVPNLEVRRNRAVNISVTVPQHELCL